MRSCGCCCLPFARICVRRHKGAFVVSCRHLGRLLSQDLRHVRGYFLRVYFFSAVIFFGMSTVNQLVSVDSLEAEPL